MTNSINPDANPYQRGCANREHDVFKHAAAQAIHSLLDAITMVNESVPDGGCRAAIILTLQHVATNVLDREIATLPEPQWYSAGWPVISRVDLGLDCGCVHIQVWHPDGQHEANRSRELPAVPCPRGGRHRLFVVSPGEVEVVDDGVPDAR
ncbi:hypothetical protein [Mycolicibacterium goodii]|uniref:hypothetical protein n=1 Tax=Mycolicibacterium goodii TaxID=134601 RepID=UPI001BDD9913|nr:hypothetical protein [Mycolicibacterium goodii]MBU8831162.1 hypothetical protein [Mycolicibacterium goodii]